MPETTPPLAPLQITALHRQVLEQVLDKWSLQVMEELCQAPCRFSALRRAMPAVTGKSLTATLRRLERNGLVERTIVSSRPVAVEYRISALGKTLRGPVEALLRWSSEHLPEVEAARERFDG